jgi:hypothetical protein
MAEIKTKPTSQKVEDFLQNVTPDSKQKEGFELLQMFRTITKEQGEMWGASIVGFGTYHYKSERSSQEGDWMIVGFSPRKQNLTLYIMHGNEESQDLLKKLGKHKTGMGCLYINKLSDVDIEVLKELITRSFQRKV